MAQSIQREACVGKCENSAGFPWRARGRPPAQLHGLQCLREQLTVVLTSRQMDTQPTPGSQRVQQEPLSNKVSRSGDFRGSRHIPEKGLWPQKGKTIPEWQTSPSTSSIDQGSTWPGRKHPERQGRLERQQWEELFKLPTTAFDITCSALEQKWTSARTPAQPSPSCASQERGADRVVLLVECSKVVQRTWSGSTTRGRIGQSCWCPHGGPIRRPGAEGGSP